MQVVGDHGLPVVKVDPASQVGGQGESPPRGHYPEWSCWSDISARQCMCIIDSPGGGGDGGGCVVSELYLFLF